MPITMFKKVGFFHFGTNHNDPVGSLQSAIDNGGDISDSLIVLPEGFNIGKFYRDQGSCDYNRSILSKLACLSERACVAFVAGLIIDQDNSCYPPYGSAYLIDGPTERLMCYKMEDDGTGNYTPCPSDCDFENPVVYKNTCIASLICMDWRTTRRGMILKKVGECPNNYKIMCIPAVMDSFSFSGGKCGDSVQISTNTNLIVANSHSQQSGCNSFITNKKGKIIMYPRIWTGD